MLQWGRGLSTAETKWWACNPPEIARFNGAAVFQPRKPQGLLHFASRANRFNGAAVFQPRKQLCSSIAWAATGGFNGAAVFQPRKPVIDGVIAILYHALQWGRGLSTAETRQNRSPNRRNQAQASMGPRSFNRGNDAVRIGAPPYIPASMGPRSFNRGNIPFETWMDLANPASMGPRSFNRGNALTSIRFPIRVLPLQWGRGLSTAETSVGSSVVHPTPAASMGPRSFNRGNPCPQWKSQCLFNGASMGPRSFNRGNLDFDHERAAKDFPLQWGRGLSTAETYFPERISMKHDWASMGPRSFNRGN